MLSEQELIDLVLLSFELEKNRDTKANKAMLHEDFSVTEMCEWYDGTVFRKLRGKDMEVFMDGAFKTPEREYEFKHVLADAKTQTVMVEFIESYPDPKNKKVFRTPQVTVCKVKNGKIYRTRHYLDPRLSYKYLKKDEVNKAFE